MARELRDNLVEAKDRSLEVTLARPGGLLWREMKENARLASEHPDGKGAMQLLYDARAEGGLESRRRPWVGSCTSSAQRREHLRGARRRRRCSEAGIKLRTVQFMAPAITVDLFRQLVLPLVEGREVPTPDESTC